MKKSLSLFILALMTIMTSLAQESGEQFTVATLNVDGLPQKLWSLMSMQTVQVMPVRPE